MKVYDLKYIGYDGQYAKYKLLLNGREIIPSILFEDGQDYVIDYGKFDDLWREWSKDAEEPYYTGRLYEVIEDRAKIERETKG